MDTPKWKDWQQRGIAELWEAVTLSCNVEPEVLRTLSRSSFSDTLKTGKLGQRLAIAKAGVKTGALATVSHRAVESLMYRDEVRFSEFAAWAASQGWKLPKRFPRIDPIITSVRNAKRWPWGNHETKLLCYLAMAAERFWIRYDPQDPSTAPTNDQVIAWLKNKGVASRVSEVMAQILRADGLPAGPRK